jgi:pimeloyl-ACP methyl ester carboxylesterase
MLIAVVSLALQSVAANVQADPGPAIMDRYATVNGVKLHYLVAGKGAAVILLHGYAQNSHMWRPLMKELAKTHLVVAPDLEVSAIPRSPNPATTRKRWRKTSTRWPSRWASGKRAWPGTTSA